MRHFSPALVLIVAILIPGVSGGCGDIDWNWDTRSRKQRRRVVHPAKPRQPTQDSDTQGNTPSGDRASGVDGARPPIGGEEAIARSPSQPGAPASSRDNRLYYNLYLVSAESASAPTRRDESRVELQDVGARTCASLLEMLYVPLGRSGSADECYLIYERPDELEAARAFAPKLDIRPAEKSTPAAGPEAPLTCGVAGFGFILDSGALVEREVMASCRRNLAEAAQSSQLTDQQRWAAAIFAARLTSEYEYDYAAARSFCDQARRSCKADSIERMTADWWRADTFVQEGKTPDAIEAYQDLVDAHWDRRSESNIVGRAEAILKKLGGS